MTISSQARTAGPFACNGSTTVFPFAFKVFSASDVAVVFRDDASGVETTLVLTIDYTVSLNADQDANPGGSISTLVAFAAGSTLTLTSKVPYLQPTDLTNQGGFYPKVITAALDRLTIFAQQILNITNRALRFPISDGNLDGTLPSKEQRKGKMLAFDETSGLPIVGPDVSDIRSVADYANDVAQFNATYQGPKAADPTARNDGSPLQQGDMYYNTTVDHLRTYTGSRWSEANAGSVIVQQFTGDGTTASFQLNTTPDNENTVQVFIGGVYQSKTGYNLTGAGGDVLTFTSAPPNGAAIEAVTFSVLPLGTVDDTQVQMAGGGTLADLNPLFNAIVDVTQFGAVGDGVTDDSAAVQAAIDFVQTNPAYQLDTLREGYGATIFFPQGRYKVTGLSVSKFNIEFKGVIGASFLVNASPTGQMLTAAFAGGTNTIGGIFFTDIEIRNTVDRDDGAGPVVLLDKLVRGGFHRFRFYSSSFETGSYSYKKCDGIKMIAPFEIKGDILIQGCKGIALDIISGPQSDSIDLEVLFKYNTVGLVGFRGAGGSGNNNLTLSGKILGYQGGTYVSDSQDAYAKTTLSATATNTNTITVASATNMKVGKAVVIGATNTMQIAMIKTIVGSTLTLDRNITAASGDDVVSGSFGFVSSEVRNIDLQNMQLEGLDVGFYGTSGTRNVTFKTYAIGSVAKPILMNTQFRKCTLSDGVCSTAGTMANGVTWKLLTILAMSDRFGIIDIRDNPADGSGYFVTDIYSLVENLSANKPYLKISTRTTGEVYAAKNSQMNMRFVDNTFMGFERSATNQFCRMRWDENGTAKWVLDFTNTAGDIIWKRDTYANSIKLSGVNGIPEFGDGAWDGIPTKIGAGYLWIDADGALRYKNGAPNADTDGYLAAKYSSAWDSTSKLRLGNWRFWVDATGDLRMKGSEPTSDTDGAVVGTQT